MPKLKINIDLDSKRPHRNLPRDLMTNIIHCIDGNRLGCCDKDHPGTKCAPDKVSVVFTAEDADQVREHLKRELAGLGVTTFALEKLPTPTARGRMESEAETKTRLGQWMAELKAKRDKAAEVLANLQAQHAKIVAAYKAAVYAMSDQHAEELAGRIANGESLEGVTSDWADPAKLDFTRCVLGKAISLAQARLTDAEIACKPKMAFHVEMPLTAPNVDASVQIWQLKTAMGAAGVGESIAHRVNSDGTRGTADFVSDRASVARSRLDRVLAERNLTDASIVFEFSLT